MNGAGELETTADRHPEPARSSSTSSARPSHRLDPALELGEHEPVELGDQLGPTARLAELAGEDPPALLCRGPHQLALVGER